MVRLEGKEYDIRNKTICDCGNQFTLKDITKLERINQPGFYGNVLNHYSHARCKKCGKDVILFLKQAGQTWEIIDTGEEHNKITTKTSQTVENKPNNVIDEEKKTGNEIVCEICGRVCKSQIGYNAHKKAHQNQN